MPKKKTITEENQIMSNNPADFIIPTGSITNNMNTSYNHRYNTMQQYDTNNDSAFASFSVPTPPMNNSTITSDKYHSTSSRTTSYKSGKVVDVFFYMNDKYYCKGVPSEQIDNELFNNNELSCVQVQYNQVYNNLVFSGYTNIHSWFDPNGYDFRIRTYGTKTYFYFELYNNYAFKVLNMKPGDVFYPKTIRFTDTSFTNVSTVQFNKLSDEELDMYFTPVNGSSGAFKYSFKDENYERFVYDLEQVVYRLDPYYFAKINFGS